MNNLSELWQSAEDLLAEEEYERAIETLEEIKHFSSQLRPEKLILLKQTFIEAYIFSGDYKQAIPLCLSLINTNKPELKIWAEAKLKLIDPQREKVNESKVENDKTIDRKIEFKSIAEFKSFCLENLIDDLNKFEQKRTKAIITIAIATVFFIVAIYFIAKGIHLFDYIPECIRPTRGSVYAYRRSSRICRRILQYRLLLSGAIATAFLLSTLAWITLIQRTVTLYGRGFKTKVIRKILNFIDPDRRLTYLEQVNLVQVINVDLPAINAAVINSRFFNNKSSTPSYIIKDDCVWGRLSNIELF